MNKYRYTIEMMRIIASFAVVMIHTMYQSHLIFSEPGNNLYLPFYNFLKFAVPIFVMISGAICLDPNRKFNLFKSIKRIIIPLFSFGIVFSSLEHYFVSKKISIDLLFNGIKDVLLGQSWDIFWYLYMLIGLYLIMPILKSFVTHSTKKDFVTIIIILSVFLSIIPWLERLFTFTSPIPFPIASVYILYLFIGFYLDKYRINKFVSIAILGIGIAIMLLSTLLGKEIGYYNIQIIFFSSGIYSLILSCEEKIESFFNKNNRGKRMLIISRSTFGVYIIHMFYTNLLYKVIRFNPYSYNVIFCWLLIGIAIWIISIITIIIIQRIPIVNKIWNV